MIAHTDNPLLLWYVAGWIAFCLLAVGILVSDRIPVRGELQQYWAYLTMPWKLAIFAPAFLFVSFAGRFTDDETWDVVTGGGMSVLTEGRTPVTRAGSILSHEIFGPRITRITRMSFTSVPTPQCPARPGLVSARARSSRSGRVGWRVLAARL